MKNLFLILFIGGFLISSCGAQETAAYKILNSTEYAQAISKGNVQIIDVRTLGEYNSGYIKNALNIDVTAGGFDSKVGKLKKDQPVYIYCRSGARSRNAGRIMESLGFKEIYDLKGGILNWNGETVR